MVDSRIKVSRWWRAWLEIQTEQRQVYAMRNYFIIIILLFNQFTCLTWIYTAATTTNNNTASCQSIKTGGRKKPNNTKKHTHTQITFNKTKQDDTIREKNMLLNLRSTLAEESFIRAELHTRRYIQIALKLFGCRYKPPPAVFHLPHQPQPQRRSNKTKRRGNFSNM